MKRKLFVGVLHATLGDLLHNDPPGETFGAQLDALEAAIHAFRLEYNIATDRQAVVNLLTAYTPKPAKKEPRRGKKQKPKAS